MLLFGAVLITLSSQVKLPSLLALGFVATALARRLGGSLRPCCWSAGDERRGAGGDGRRRLGQRAGVRVDLYVGHRQCGA
ncbi:mannosyltransferase MptB domain protein [Mycobacterium xenopi 3993]|nr:mannosyltransferase MptB domain protein [Mycobacterium xenopi 3993]